ncbi:DNA recombination protein RmuC [Alloscardovia venturai]|uniref:DNA recombination protein RmuC n=1 Tax=Alloscardovia venturai TaxID=1769421 RepID=A0ABW2Y1Q9_9BIFI
MFETILALVIGIVVGGALGFLYAQQKHKSMSGSSIDMLHMQQQIEELTAARTDLTAQLEEGRSALASEREANAKLEGQLQGVNEQLLFAQDQLQLAQQAEKERISHEKAMTAQREEAKRREQADSMAQESKILKALSPVQKNLDMLQQKVADIEENRKKEMGKLDEQLQGLGSAQQKLDRETTNLAMVLRDNKVRGAWGEAQLKNIVESAGLREHVDFETQYYVENEDGRQQRPDMVVMLPDGKYIPIDAKVPYSDYQRACEIPDTASEDQLKIRDEHLRAHAKALRAHVDTLGKREYWKNNGDRVAPDFVIAFIPNESLLQAALDVDPTILDYAFNKQVALTSPVTLWSVLKSVTFAWQQQTLSEDAQQLFDLSREMFKRLSKMSEHAAKLGKHIGSTVQSYNAFVGSLQSQVTPTLRRLNKLEPGADFTQPELLEDEKKSDIREITAPELSPNWDEE